MTAPPAAPVVIPARLGARRLPRKPLADIHGRPMIVHVWERARRAAVGPVVVACAEAEIAAAVERAGGRAVMTRPDHATGSDRVFEALERFDPDGRFAAVVNLQGDLPTVAPAVIRAALAPLCDPEVDIGTVAFETDDPDERDDPNVVKAVVAPHQAGARIRRAVTFVRRPEEPGGGPVLHHVGIYAFRRATLARFVALAPSEAEKRETLEQLRALDAGMRIGVALVDRVEGGVDTPADLERARAAIASRAATPHGAG